MEYEINLENLVKMKRVFEVRCPLPSPPRRHAACAPAAPARCPRSTCRCPPPTRPPTRLPARPSARPQEADEDGSGELDPGEFYEKLGPYLGQALSEAQVALLFMRIDADCGGTIDWEVGAGGCWRGAGGCCRVGWQWVGAGDQ